jgi:xylulose-5-phosphate/fructose-6-phosphate phosphoketolase
MTTIDVKDVLLLTAEEARRMNAYWRAANYLSVGQIHLSDNRS